MQLVADFDLSDLLDDSLTLATASVLSNGDLINQNLFLNEYFQFDAAAAQRQLLAIRQIADIITRSVTFK